MYSSVCIGVRGSRISHPLSPSLSLLLYSSNTVFGCSREHEFVWRGRRERKRARRGVYISLSLPCWSAYTRARTQQAGERERDGPAIHECERRAKSVVVADRQWRKQRKLPPRARLFFDSFFFLHYSQRGRAHALGTICGSPLQ